MRDGDEGTKRLHSVAATLITVTWYDETIDQSTEYEI
jgi:hypothetical protein